MLEACVIDQSGVEADLREERGERWMRCESNKDSRWLRFCISDWIVVSSADDCLAAGLVLNPQACSQRRGFIFSVFEMYVNKKIFFP